IPHRVSGTVSLDDLRAAREIADIELATSPSVFHVVENGRYEMERLLRAVENATSRVSGDDPLMISAQGRIDALDHIIREARDWSRNPSQSSFREFMERHALPANIRDYEISHEFDSDGRFRFQEPMGPLELFYRVADEAR